MKVSASIELVWQLSAQEAIASEHKEIEPEHFLAALLKFAELPGDEIEKLAPGSAAIKDLIADMAAVQQDLEDRAIDTTRVRRDLRAAVGKGNCPYDALREAPQPVRDLFDAAARLADNGGNDTLAASHLLLAILASPTPAMVQVLGNKAAEPALGPSKTPLLNKYGRDLVAQAAGAIQEPAKAPEGWMVRCKERPAESRALLHALALAGRPAILLLSDDDEVVHSVVAGAASTLAIKEGPKQLVGQRIIDVRAIESPRDASAPEPVSDFTARVRAVLAEASKLKGVILFVPSISAAPEDERARAWQQIFRDALARGEIRCICRAVPSADNKWLRTDPLWRRATQVMWVRKTAAADDVPREL